MAWSFWDWGSSAYNAVTVAFVFSVYLTEAVGDDLPGSVSPSTWLAWAMGIAGFVVAVLAPVTGQLFDALARRKLALGVLTGATVLVLAAMFFVVDDYHYLWFGLLLLGLAAVLLALLVGIPLGTLAALRQNSPTDYGIMGVAVLGIALPSFVTGPLFALIFGLYLRWLPVAGWETGQLRYLVLPVITLALPVIAYIARLTRGSLLEVLRTNFVRTARAKGLPERQVILRHALRPALLPVVSYLGPATAFVITGSLVVETVFGLPGSGRYLVQGAINRDYTLVMGMIVVYGGLTLTLNLVADLIYGWLDPRVRYD